MSDAARALVAQVLALPPSERALVVEELLASIEAETPDELAGRRAALERRIREVEEGRVKAVPFDEALAGARRAVEQARAARGAARPTS